MQTRKTVGCNEERGEHCRWEGEELGMRTESLRAHCWPNRRAAECGERSSENDSRKSKLTRGNIN